MVKLADHSAEMPSNSDPEGAANALRQILQNMYNEFVSDVGWEEATPGYWFHPDHFNTWERLRQACPEITVIMQRIEERGYYADQVISRLFDIAISVLVENDQSVYTMQDIRRTIADLELCSYESDDESEEDEDEDEEDDENEGSGPMDEDRVPQSTDVQMGF